ncbi:hypothetical protein ABZ897_58145 [Nonomuraea sp. NPDC046802]|uniref:hypothetical protein n=1 Tax=Nonomuraea sp. NPDC046802 TaxID=3154919 RepID=UPI0033F89549
MRHEKSNAWNRCACCPEPRQPVGLDPIRPLSALETADELRAALARMGIPADVHEGLDLALVSVWTGLAVWTDGFWYRWWTGRRSRTGRWLYAHHPAFEPERAALRIAARYAELREAPSVVAVGA